jgi:hypothetical protein
MIMDRHHRRSRRLAAPAGRRRRCAIPLFREDLAGCRAALGDDHKDTRDSLRNLVGLLQEQGAAQEAAQLQDLFNDG